MIVYRPRDVEKMVADIGEQPLAALIGITVALFFLIYGAGGMLGMMEGYASSQFYNPEKASQTRLAKIIFTYQVGHDVGRWLGEKE